MIEGQSITTCWSTCLYVSDPRFNPYSSQTMVQMKCLTIVRYYYKDVFKYLKSMTFPPTSSVDRLCGSGNIGREIWVVNIALFLLSKQGNCFPLLQTGLCARNYPRLQRGITSMWGQNRRFINHKVLQISKNNSNYLDTHGKPLGIEVDTVKPSRARMGL